MAKIPERFIDFIDQGRCALFLGAGASAAAGAPSGSQMGQALVRKYLGDSQWDLGLESAASLIEASLGNRPEVEHDLQEALESLKPSSAHQKIPWFRWRAIVTTNYDRLVEKAYKRELYAVQKLKVIAEEVDLSDREPPDTLPLIKPHGCISRPHEISVSSEDIYEAKLKRRLLFERIAMLHVLGPVVYVGYSLHDRHILDMIYDLTKRLGSYRSPILFVTHQSGERAAMERRWFENVLQSEYRADGFESFMNQLARDITPAIAPSFIIPQLAPCKLWAFGTCTHSLIKSNGEWECWLNYTIASKEGFAGVIFERRGSPLDFAKFTKVVFELNVTDAPRKKYSVEALKLEGMKRVLRNLIDISHLKGLGWKEVSVSFDKSHGDLPRRLQRVVLADNGSLAALGEEYRLGIRKVRFA